MRAFATTQPFSLDELPSIDDALAAFRAHIEQYRRVLNDEGIWLFLSTLGCWGVTQPVFQYLAFTLTVWLFGARVQGRYTERKSFRKLEASLHARIMSETEAADLRTKRLLVLEQVSKAYRFGAGPLRASMVFMASWLFYGASFAYLCLDLSGKSA